MQSFFEFHLTLSKQLKLNISVVITFSTVTMTWQYHDETKDKEPPRDFQ